jgi:hypothetical protein
MAAAKMKRLAGQINVINHSLGILLCLPHILEVGEQVEKVSLGAGNTGREFEHSLRHLAGLIALDLAIRRKWEMRQISKRFDAEQR